MEQFLGRIGILGQVRVARIHRRLGRAKVMRRCCRAGAASTTAAACGFA
jgi:hypothetical protein